MNFKVRFFIRTSVFSSNKQAIDNENFILFLTLVEHVRTVFCDFNSVYSTYQQLLFPKIVLVYRQVIK